MRLLSFISISGCFNSCKIVEGLDQKKLEVLEVKEVLMDVLADFEEQECLVRSIFAQLGFDENFIESTSIMT